MRHGNYETDYYLEKYNGNKFVSDEGVFSDFKSAVEYARQNPAEGYKIRKVTFDVNDVEHINDIIWEEGDKVDDNIFTYESLTDEERDYIYRKVWKDHVKEDVKNMYEDMDEGRVERIAEMYVNEGEYDCNLSYWSNLENLVSSTGSF